MRGRNKQVWRPGLVAGVMTLALIGIAARLAYLHLAPSPDERDALQRRRVSERKVPASRGLILDGSPQASPLAMNLNVKNICADPRVVQQSNAVDRVARALATHLNLDALELRRRLARENSRYWPVERYVPEERAAALMTNRLPGVFTEDVQIRHYPQREFLCHILGFVNREGVGSLGIEQLLDRDLRGAPGFMECPVDANRRALLERTTFYVPPVAGATVTLTVDQNIQFMVEKTLDETMAQHQARGAWAIVQRVRTGEILAMASRPAFDLNEFNRSGEDERMNRAIGFVYEPGSTFKVIAVGGALNEGVVKPGQVFDCENGLWHYAGKPLRDYHPYGRLTVADGLKKSSNILTAKVALMLGNERLYHYLRAFGIGTRLGLDLPGEEAGILAAPARWSAISPTRIPIGQGVAVTALQMVGVFAALANDGFLMRPYVVSQIVNAEGQVILRNQPQALGRPLAEGTARLMCKLLTGVTEEGGTGLRARVEGYEVAGKTGTAQKPVNGVYSSTAYFASFVGLLPAQAPEIAIIVVVDEPQPYHTGGVVAAPAFARIASQAARYLDLPPDGQRAQVAGGRRP